MASWPVVCGGGDGRSDVHIGTIETPLAFAVGAGFDDDDVDDAVAIATIVAQCDWRSRAAGHSSGAGHGKPAEGTPVQRKWS